MRLFWLTLLLQDAWQESMPETTASGKLQQNTFTYIDENER
jgi:hypothetical protein